MGLSMYVECRSKLRDFRIEELKLWWRKCGNACTGREGRHKRWPSYWEKMLSSKPHLSGFSWYSLYYTFLEHFLHSNAGHELGTKIKLATRKYVKFVVVLTLGYQHHACQCTIFMRNCSFDWGIFQCPTDKYWNLDKDSRCKSLASSEFV
jgi:hypothetical protein